MARLPRLSVPGFPHHILQRGNNRQSIFKTPDDYRLMLGLVEDSASQYGVAVHAYVLMENHFHLLVTPQTTDGVSRMMQAVGRRYVRHFNRAHGRSGTLWEGRYKSTLIEEAPYLLPCMAYLDLNPVRMGLVAQARDYPWSSHGRYLGLHSSTLITPHPLYWALGNTPFDREAAYAELVHSGVSASQQKALTDSVLFGWALGGSDFVKMLEQKTGRRARKVGAGRPPSRQPEA
jgi:putative transposase